jgi:hypothetical protein
MKKILISIILLLVAWAASLLYAGHHTEKLLTQYTSRMNQEYQKLDLGIRLELTKFDSNFFNAKTQYAVKVDVYKLMRALDAGLNNEDNSAKLKNVFKEPFIFIINQNVQYGPIFFDDGLEFAMAKINYQSTLSDFIKTISTKVLPLMQQKNKKLDVLTSTINQALRKKVAINFDSTLSFFSDIVHTEGVIDEININERVIISKTIFDDMTNIKNLTGYGKFNISNITIKDKNRQSAVEMQDLSISYNRNEFIDFFNSLGDFKFDIQKIGFNSPMGKVSLAITADVKSKRNNKMPDLSDNKFSMRVEALEYPEQTKLIPFDLPKIVSVSWSLNGFNNTELNTIFRKLNQYSDIVDAGNKVPEGLINEIASSFDKAFIKQISNFGFNIDITTIQQPKIHNTLNLDVVHNFHKGDMKQLLTMINQDGYSQKISELMQDAVIANLKVKVNAKLLAIFEEKLQLLTQQGAITKDLGFYQTDVNYKNRKLTVNGKNISAAVIKQFIPMPKAK